MSNKLIRKNHSSAFKFTVVLNYLKGDKTMIELSREYGVSTLSIGRWVKHFKENGKNLFNHDPSQSSSANSDLQEKEINNLYSKIGQLTVERDFLKKALDS